jgi:CRISPR/Cas system CMR-associated protein Cmr5 small subunit
MVIPMDKKKKQEKFEEFYGKFVRKCLSENMLPTMTIRYEHNGIFPLLDFYEVNEKEKEEILSSLNKK